MLNRKFPVFIYLLALITLLPSNSSSAQTENDILFWKAVQDNNIHKVDSFISLGVDLNITNNDKWTPMFVASYYGYIEIAELLIQNGADIHARSNDSKTPLFVAVENKEIAVARLLLNAGADIEAATDAQKVSYIDVRYWTIKKDKHFYPLHAAVCCEDLEMVKLLLEYGANVNALTLNNWTPSMIAAKYSSVDILIELYLNKADLGIRNSKGETAEDIALIYGTDEIIAFLKDPYTVIQKKYGQIPILTTSLGHSDLVTQAVFSPDGKFLITGSNDNTFKLWDLELGMEIRSFAGYSYGVSAMACDFENNLLVGADMNTLKIWDLETGGKIAAFSETDVEQVALSKDNKLMLTGSNGNGIKLWDLEKKKMIREIGDFGTSIINLSYHDNTLFFDDDNNPFLANAMDSIIKLWDLSRKKLYKEFSGHSGTVSSLSISNNGKNLVSGSKDKTIKIWDIETGKVIHELNNNIGTALSLSYSSDDRYIVSASDKNIIQIWEAETGKLQKELMGGGYIEALVFINQDKSIAAISSYDTLKMWDILSGELTHCQSLNKQSNLNSLALEFDNNTYISGAKNNPLKTWNIQEKNKIQDLPVDFSDFTAAALSSDNTFAITGDEDGSLCQWDLITGDLLKTFPVQSSWIDNLEISSDNNLLLAVNSDSISLFDVNNSQLILSLEVGYSGLASLSPDNKSVIYANEDSASIYDIESGEILKKIGYNMWDLTCLTMDSNQNYIVLGSSEADLVIKDLNDENNTRYTLFEPIVKNVRQGLIFEISTWTSDILCVNSVALSSDNRYIAAGLSDNTIRILDIQQKHLSEIKVLTGHTDEIRSVAFADNDELLITTSGDKTIKIWETARWKELATLISIGEDDWIVTTPEGLFDASPDAMSLIYYTQGFEIFELGQLKDRYYEPGLLQKILGFNDEPVRDVTKLDKLDLYPEIKLNQPENGLLEIDLANRGGGIGPVKIFINGKEIASDARGENIDPNAKELNITLDLKDHPYLKPDAENIIEVKAANGEGYLVSRGVKVSYYPEEKEPAEIPRLFVVSSGISDYTGDDIDLKYAAKDAEDMAHALEIGAKRLFGTDKTFTWLLTTNQENSSLQPSRVNLIRTFEEIAQKAKSTDILVLYFSGHGINWGGQDGDFYYLTKDAYTAEASAYNDPAIRGLSTISSNEMVEYIKKIPALKQVLIIDACASGKMVENLVTQRDISSSTLRALDRMKDRTGMHIITGCTADAVSYEASRYGQGVLTYSLLEGIKGTALRDERFVDVNLLYQYARERVPELAEGIGGIQKPEVFSPYGAESFDIGEVNSTDKEEIPLARIKTVFVRSVFQDEDELEDVLGLSAAIDEMLNEISRKGNGKSLIFVNAREFPDSYKLSGLYSQQGDMITVKMKIRSADLSESFIITGANIEELKLNILSQINSSLKN